MLFIIKSHLMKGSIWFQLNICRTAMRRFRKSMLISNSLQNFNISIFSDSLITIWSIVSCRKSPTSSHISAPPFAKRNNQQL